MAHFFDASQLAGAACFNRGSLLLQSDDFDEVRARVGDVFKPHKLTLSGSAKHLHSRMHHARWGNLSLNLLDYGDAVTIEPGRLDRFFLLQMPLSGQAEIECGACRFLSGPGVASLISPTLPLRMRWGDACPQAILRIERDELERHAARHFGEIPRGSLEFEPAFALSSAHGASLMQLLSILAEVLSDESHPLRHPMAFEPLESALLNTLLYGQPNSARAGMQ